MASAFPENTPHQLSARSIFPAERKKAWTQLPTRILSPTPGAWGENKLLKGKQEENMVMLSKGSILFGAWRAFSGRQEAP